ncbi:hypothetical protein MUB35_19850 [Blautia sp. NSJ-175]|uniref:hypothetical protein n=1 Tax=Blautia sp. NSJ-175 TaxID=2931396 RepID=UPI001FD5FD38|nr:hypothetical protein [Blautia sp. NSJ-175]MCJ7847580.1 hypothetical protein [Blautia sp. NSJ-175]
MNNKMYIDYLNSLHNYNAQNENAYGEKNVDSPYFEEVMVRVGLCDYIKDNLTEKEPHIVILTGHAGDGKTSIMYQVLTDLGAEFDAKEKMSEISLPNGAKCLCVKDFSELPEEETENQTDRIHVMRKSVDIVENGNYVFMVANTGPLINTFGELFDAEEEKEKARIRLINMMDNNAGEVVSISGVRMCVINVATIDNVYFATEFLEKITQDKLWEGCKNCKKYDYCYIYRNRQLIIENKTKVFEFVHNHFIWLTEYGIRLTIRSMAEQLAYMLTGGMSCEEVAYSESYKYLFSNLFFGYIGTKQNERALNIIAVDAANRCLYDHKRMRSDEKLLVGKEYKKLFGNAIEGIIVEAEHKNAFVSGWTEFLRRTYLFMNIVTDEKSVLQDYEDIFSKQFKRYLALRDRTDTPSKLDTNLIEDALSMIYVGTPSDGTEIPLTLSRESGITQNVQLITGTIPVRRLRIEQIKTIDSIFNKGKDRYELKLKIDRAVLDTVLTLPMLDYFEELKNGVIATNIDPQLSHGVESLKSQISEILKDYEDEDIVEIVVLKNSGNENIRLELTDDGKIREV